MLAEVRRWLAEARSVAVLTGAGISAESGIPTFRGPGGLWRNFRPEQLATPEAFARDPRLVWEWYLWRRGLIAAAEPNAGHRALVTLAERYAAFTLITQNVDGLHERAGSRGVLEIHGNIWITRCPGCGYQRRDGPEAPAALPPPCPACGRPLRPGVVWFGETLPEAVWAQAVDAARRAAVLLVIGTSAQVWPAASLIGLAERTVTINIDGDPLLRGPAGAILPQLL